MTKELEAQELALLEKISEYNIQNSEMQLQIAANNKEIALLELARYELRLSGTTKRQCNLQGDLM